MTVFDLPSDLLQECTFTLDDGTVSSVYNHGKSLMITQIYDPVWRISVQSAPLDQAGMQVWTSWKAKLRGGLNSFRATDISRRAPLNYQTARAPGEIAAGWTGTATLASFSMPGALNLTGLPPGYVAKEGDRISLEYDDYVSLHEISADAIASAGGALSLVVEPFLPRGLPTGALARLWRPVALFAIDWTSWRMTVTATPSPVSFNGYQAVK